MDNIFLIFQKNLPEFWVFGENLLRFEFFELFFSPWVFERMSKKAWISRKMCNIFLKHCHFSRGLSLAIPVCGSLFLCWKLKVEVKKVFYRLFLLCLSCNFSWLAGRTGLSLHSTKTISNNLAYYLLQARYFVSMSTHSRVKGWTN